MAKIQAILSKKFAQSLDAFGFIHYLCTDLSHGRTLRGGQPKLGSITITGGAFVIITKKPQPHISTDCGRVAPHRETKPNKFII